MANITGWISIFLCVCFTLWLARMKSEIGFAIWVAFGLRTAVSLTNYYTKIIPKIINIDAVKFEKFASDWSQEGFVGTFQYLDFTDSFVYSFVASVLYSLFGRSPLMLQTLNVALGILIVVISYELAKVLWDYRAACYTAWFTALFPASILYSSIIMREVWIILPFMVGLLGSILWYQRRQIKFIWISLLGYLFGTIFHDAVLFSLGVFLVHLVVFDSRYFFRWLRLKIGSRSKFYTFLLFFSILVLGLGASAWNSLFSLPKLSMLFQGLSQREIIHVLEHSWEMRAKGGAVYLENSQINSLWDFLRQCVLRTVYFLFLPFPWMIRTPLDIWGIFDSMTYLLMTVVILAKSGNLLNSQKRRYILIVVSIMIFIFAMGTSNYGTAIRHRAKFAPSLFAVSGLISKPENTSSIDAK